MLLATLLQVLDQMVGFPTGFDVVADHLEQWLTARQFIATLKMV